MNIPEWEVDKTDRGFEIVRFNDRYQEKCSLQQSSAPIYDQPGSGAIWLGTSDHRMSLDLEDVIALHAYLGEWIESGSFSAAEEKALNASQHEVIVMARGCDHD